MGAAVQRIVVVSAQCIRKGGTLTILRDCLSYLSANAKDCKIVALVHDKSLCCYPGIDYIELPWCSKSWFHRFWAEYIYFHRLSLEIAQRYGVDKVWLWLSLHDFTPRVVAERQELYCQTSFPFIKLRALDFWHDPKLALLAVLSRWAYRINVKKNDSIIVQQQWFADSMSKILNVPIERFRVIAPQNRTQMQPASRSANSLYTFLYVSTPDFHKNFELLCKAAALLESKLGKEKFRVVITVSGTENRYARYLKRNWGSCSSIDFRGLVPREQLPDLYASADCLVFPSRIETWGLPISEYLSVQPEGKMLLADLPYAHETAGEKGEYFKTDDVRSLAELMEEQITR